MGNKSSFVMPYVNHLAEYLTKWKYGNHDEYYRNTFIKYYYVGLLYRYRYLAKDHLIKNKYKLIKYNGEFGPELKYAIPFAYWHYKNGTLSKTISSKNTKELYYFSGNHEEYYEKRVWRPYVYGIPNSEDHNVVYNFKQWLPIPYKQKYKNDLLLFDKPILIIANKYNYEWGEKPVNYLSVELLRWIFDHYADRYQIIYNRPGSNKIVNDNSDILQLDDYTLIHRDYQNVIDMNELYEKRKSDKIKNYNHFQLLLYANTNHFISVHGGASVLASYFNGMNIIYSVKGFEHYFNEFENFYPKLSGAKIFHAKTNNDVMNLMKQYY